MQNKNSPRKTIKLKGYTWEARGGEREQDTRPRLLNSLDNISDNKKWIKTNNKKNSLIEAQFWPNEFVFSLPPWLDM